MNSKLRHVSAAVYDRPWYATPAALTAVDEIVQFHVAGGRLSADEIEARLALAGAAAGPRRGARTMGAVAVIPVYGLIFPRANLMTEYSGGATVSGIRDAFRESLADESIGSILFDVDSPGGYTDGIEELATEIRAARGVKPIVAIAQWTMASAAYYLAAGADEIVASPSSSVGWIGCVMVHQEFSKMDELDGVTTTIIRQPAGKYGGNQYEPLSDKARAEFQATVDYSEAAFVNHVAKSRGVSPATVRASFGQGGGMDPVPARAAGLVDRVETFDDTVRRLATGKGPVSRGTSGSLADRGWTVAQEASDAALPYQGGDLALADDSEATAADEAGTPPDHTTEAEAALALARAKLTR